MDFRARESIMGVGIPEEKPRRPKEDILDINERHNGVGMLVKHFSMVAHFPIPKLDVRATTTTRRGNMAFPCSPT